MLKRTQNQIVFCVLIITWILLILMILLDAFYFLKNDWQNKGKIGTFIKIGNTYTKEKEKEEDGDDFLEEHFENRTMNLSNNNKVGEIDIFLSNCWRVKIPKLNVNAPITEGTEAEDLRRTVGHFTQTDKWIGNVALAGHNRGYRCNFFQEIKKLEKGDIIIYSTEKGERKYQVVLNKLIKDTDWNYVKNTKDNRITLITCEINKREYRRCVQAVEVK